MLNHLRRLFAGLFVAAAAVLVLPSTAMAGSPIVGDGSTWSAIAIDQWRADVARIGLAVNYTANGSSTGRALYISGQADFAVSEIPFEGTEVAQAKKRPFVYLPIVAGGTSLMYNVPEAQNSLNLDSKAAADIFTGAITYWDDKAITANNPRLTLPHVPIVPVVRSDGSGTSAQFSAYLFNTERAIWSKFSHEDHVSFWPQLPNGVAQAGSDGVANYVASQPYSITYVEAGYALQRHFPVANLKNQSGQYTQPSAQNVATALKHATFNADGTQNLQGVYHAGESSAYAMSSYSYMIAPTKGFDPAKGETLGRFILYFACEGQNSAAALGYSPLPPNLVQADFDAEAQIPGAPPPPKSAQTCSNAYTNVGGGNPNASPTPTLGGKSPGPHQSKIAKVASTGTGPVIPGAETLTDPAAVLASTASAAAPKMAVQALAGAALLGIVFGPLFLKRKHR